VFELGIRKSRSESNPSAGDDPPDALRAADESELADAQVKIPESPHVVSLRNSKGGPYYLAPDSAEPLPSGMWSELDPEKVIAEAKRMNTELTQVEHATPVPAALRQHLEHGGPAAQKLLETLDRGLEASSTELLDALYTEPS
jgi:hypothetical protein